MYSLFTDKMIESISQRLLQPDQETTVSKKLPELIRLIEKLPNELIEKILTRLPLSAIIELSIAEDKLSPQRSEDAWASGHLSQCILISPGWKRVFPSRKHLLVSRLYIRFAMEAYNLVYGRKFCHGFVRREKIGVQEDSFADMRRLLSFHTRVLGPAHPELLDINAYLRDTYINLVLWVWESMSLNWRTYMDAVIDTFSREPTGKLSFDIPFDWSRAWVRKSLVAGSSLKLAQKKLRFMVNVEREYRQRLSKELVLLSGLMKAHPLCLRVLRDQRQQPRPNVEHRADRLLKDAQYTKNIRAAAKRANAGRSHFRESHLPVMLLDKWIWFFLECRSNLLKQGPSALLEHSHDVVHNISADVATVMAGISHIYVHGRFQSELRLVFSSQVRDGGMRQVGVTDLNRLLQEGSEIRPILTEPQPPVSWREGHDLSYFSRVEVPHDEKEIAWLQAFLRCCKHFTALFPEVLEKVEKEAKEVYLPCPVAEERAEKKQKQASMNRHIAANLSARGAKFELLAMR